MLIPVRSLFRDGHSKVISRQQMAVRHGHRPVIYLGERRFAPSNRPAKTLYSNRQRKLDMVINGHRNKLFGPGGSTRRLHPKPVRMLVFGGGETGSTRV